MDSFIYSSPKGAELIQILLFILVLLLALLRVEREESLLFFEDEGSLELLVEGPAIREDNRLRLKARVLGGDFPELYEKRVFLTLYGMEDLPWRAFWVYGRVLAEGDKFLVLASWKDIKGISLREKGVRERFIERVEERIKDPEVKALTLSYLFGESQDLLPQDIFYYFRKTGLVHLLVISGFHVAMVFLVLRYTLPYPYGFFFATLGTSLYVLFLTPKDPPALRAWLMFLLWSLIKFLHGKPNSLSLLFFSGSLLLIFNPSFSKSFSFWLSFFATLYIILGLRLVKKDDIPQKEILNSFLVSLFAFLGVSPLLWSFTTNSAGSIILSPIVSLLFFPFTLYGVFQILTFFSLPSFPMELMGKLILFTVGIFSYLDLDMEIPLSLTQSFIVSTFGALLMYLKVKTPPKAGE